jgi:hypothetical protein
MGHGATAAVRPRTGALAVLPTVLLAGLSTGLLTGCFLQPAPDVDELGAELRREGNVVLEEAQVLEPQDNTGEFRFRDQNADRDVACAEDDTVKRVFAIHGIGAYGSPVRVRITADTFVGIISALDYQVDDIVTETKLRQEVLMSKEDGARPTFRIEVDDGEPVRWRVVGETQCVPAA